MVLTSEPRDWTVNRLAKWYALSRRSVIRRIEAAGIPPLPALPYSKERTFRLTNGERLKFFEPQATGPLSRWQSGG